MHCDLPISSALNATGRLFFHSNLLASSLKSNILVTKAIRGARGNAAAKSCIKRSLIISFNRNATPNFR